MRSRFGAVRDSQLADFVVPVEKIEITFESDVASANIRVKSNEPCCKGSFFVCSEGIGFDLGAVGLGNVASQVDTD